jgi:hypothetical protein
VDEVASFDAAMEALSMENSTMDPLESFKAQHPNEYKADREATFAAGRKEGFDAGKAEGLTQGAKGEKDRLAALATAIPDRPGFVIEQFNAGHNVAAAKGALADVLLQENAALKQQNAQAQSKAGEAAPQTGVPFAGGNANDGAMSEARRNELLAATSTGRAILTGRK